MLAHVRGPRIPREWEANKLESQKGVVLIRGCFQEFHLVVPCFLWFPRNTGICSILKGGGFQNFTLWFSWFTWLSWFQCEKSEPPPS